MISPDFPIPVNRFNYYKLIAPKLPALMTYWERARNYKYVVISAYIASLWKFIEPCA